jgi:uncharacterized protein (TIGR02246 family)
VGPARDAWRQFEGALDSGDLDGALSLCVPDVLFIGSGEGEQVRGVEQVRAMFARLIAGHPDTGFEVFDADLDVLLVGGAEDVALVTSFGTSRLTAPGKVRESDYRTTAVLVRTSAGWRVASVHGSEAHPWP